MFDLSSIYFAMPFATIMYSALLTLTSVVEENFANLVKLTMHLHDQTCNALYTKMDLTKKYTLGCTSKVRIDYLKLGLYVLQDELTISLLTTISMTLLDLQNFPNGSVMSCRALVWQPA